MIECQSCRKKNLPGSRFCDECGNKLEMPSLAENGEQGRVVQSISSPNFRVGGITSIGIPPIVERIPKVEDVATAGSDVPSTTARLVIERGEGANTEFLLTSDESFIGRWDADNGIFPDIDLDAFDPDAKISRRHARILRTGDRFAVEDLGSTNGTFINRGRRLLPGTPQPINEGDEIIVGKTFLRFRLNE